MTAAMRLAVLCLLAVLALAGTGGSIHAHEIRPAYLQVDETTPGRFQILWRRPVLSGMPLPVELRLPEGVNDVTEQAVQILPDSIVERRLVDAGPEGLAGGRVVFDGLQATLTDVLVRVRLANGSEATTLVRPSQSWIEIGTVENRATLFVRYVSMGVHHILFGPDHLLFVAGLMALVGSGWMLLKTITAFTIAHSITLALAALGIVHVPPAPLEVMIALSILFLGPEIARRLQGGDSLTIRGPWIVAFAFGLLHGIGFAGGLSLAGLPRGDIPLALLGFNLGVEIGQLAFVAAILAALAAFRAMGVRWPRAARFAPAYLVGALGAFWTIERVAAAIGATA